MISFFNDPATTEIYTLSLHDALPIWNRTKAKADPLSKYGAKVVNQLEELSTKDILFVMVSRSEEHTSELQSQSNLVCRLPLEEKKTTRHEEASLAPSTRPQQRCRVRS